MNKHIDPNLSPETLQTYQGYSLQVFSSGRIKLSFHRSHKDRVEYYGECPKRHRDAYTNQHNRSVLALPQHFALVDDLLLRCPHSLIHRLHLKGDNNATADNAHVITDTDDKTCHVVLNTVHHQWALPAAVVNEMLSRSGPKRGAASCFNEYVPSYDHDWMDVVFRLADYRSGHRDNRSTQRQEITLDHQDDSNF